MTTILIPATATTPAITLEDLQAITDDASLSHMRDVVRDCATQLGQDACRRAFDELERIEARLYQP